MTERQRMLDGLPYDAADPDLVAARRNALALLPRCHRDPALWRELFGTLGEGAVINPGFACDYGFNIHFGQRAFVNFNCVFLDCAPIAIGDDLQMGPGVQLLTAEHPLDPATRRTGVETARPIHIGHGVWFGGGAIVLPGVTIGDGSVIGAGSVVTRDVPGRTVVAGNPARRLRSLA